MGNSDVEVDNRCAHNPRVKRTIVHELQMFLHQNNNLVNMFKIALDRMPSDSHNIIVRADKSIEAVRSLPGQLVIYKYAICISVQD